MQSEEPPNGFNFHITDAADLIARPFDPDSYRDGYNAGHRQGWIECLENCARGLSKEAYNAAFDFWTTTLLEWHHTNPWPGAWTPEFKLTKKQKNRADLKPSLRFAILKRDDFRCRICGVTAKDGNEIRLTVDHIVARAKGGTDDESNLWTLCWPCNIGKGINDL
jgi:5-methylcytosine-specific restriction endonuclease McrA